MDNVGRDLATRILYGGRVSLAVGVLAVVVAISIGTLVGGLAGYYGGLLDGVLMRFVDLVLSASRSFLLILFVVSINFIGDGLRDALDPRHVVRTERR